MLTIAIIAIGKERSRCMQSLQADYIKRIPWNISLQELKYNGANEGVTAIQHEESKLLLRYSAKCDVKIVLDEAGQNYSSKEFALLLADFLKHNIKSIAFLIGGAYGHAIEMKQPPNITLSLSRMTFPHKMVRLILLEQLYRTHTILDHHPYHKL